MAPYSSSGVIQVSGSTKILTIEFVLQTSITPDELYVMFIFCSPLFPGFSFLDEPF